MSWGLPVKRKQSKGVASLLENKRAGISAHFVSNTFFFRRLRFSIKR